MLSEWIAHLKEQKQAAHQSARNVRASRNEVADSQQESEQPRDSLLRTWSQREPSNDDDTASDASSPAAVEPERKRSKSAKTRVQARSDGDDIINVMKSTSELMASVIEKLAGAVATAVARPAAAAAAVAAAAVTPVEPDAGIPAARISDLEAKMTRLEDRVEQTNTMLRELLDRLAPH